MVLEHKKYVPTLAIRASEMNGLEHLPLATKERMVPCILLAPWANSSTLKKGIERAEKALSHQNYFLDIDRNYEFTNTDNETQSELKSLLIQDGSFKNWCDFVIKKTKAWPCIQIRNQKEDNIRTQIERFQDAERSYCLRILINSLTENLWDAINALKKVGTADFSIIIEGEWTENPQILYAKMDGLLKSIQERIDASVPFIISCTSMPKTFTKYDGGISIVPFSNRVLVEQVQQQNNSAKIIYGDWGSTRPREPLSFANRPSPRVDYPTNSSWCIARNKDANWDYKEAAKAIIKNDEWDGNLNIWGEEMIKSTAISPILGIDSPQKNVAARINIHLHRQAFFDEPYLGGLDLDEDWQD